MTINRAVLRRRVDDGAQGVGISPASPADRGASPGVRGLACVVRQRAGPQQDRRRLPLLQIRCWEADCREDQSQEAGEDEMQMHDGHGWC